MMKGGFNFAVLLAGILYVQLQTCSAGTSPASKLLSGIWTEEGCIVPHDDKSRKIWGVATVWLLDDPVDPCNSPCGCPPQGLNPPLQVKPGNAITGGIVSVPLVVQPLQIPTPRPPPVKPVANVPPTVTSIPPGCIIPAARPLNITGGVFLPPVSPSIRVPPIGHSYIPFPPQPLFVPPPVFGPLLPPPPRFVGPLLPPPRPHFIAPPPLPPVPHVPIVPRPVVRPLLERVPIDFGSFHAPPASAPVSSGTVATGHLIVTPPQVGVSTGSTTVTQEDWDKEKFNATYDKDKGSKQTVSTTGGVSTVPCTNTVVGTPGTTTVTQEDWDKQHLNANYDKDKGSKQTVSTTGGTVGRPGSAIYIPPQVGTAPTTTITQEDWDKEKLNANYNKDKGSKNTFTTTTGSGPAFVAAPEPCMCAPGTHPTISGHVPSVTTISQEDWDKQNMNMQYDRDHGSKTNATSTGVNFGNTGGYLAYPFAPHQLPYGPPPAPVMGPVQYPPSSQHLDIGLLLPPVPAPQGPYAVVLQPTHHYPYGVFPHQIGPSMSYLPNHQGASLTPSYNLQQGPLDHSTVNLGHPSVINIPHDGLSPRPFPVPTSHGIHSISKVPVVGPLLKPILEPVIIDFGDHSTNTPTPVYPLNNITQDLPSPHLPMHPTTDSANQPEPGRIPSFISKIPIVGPLLKPYLEPVAVNVGNVPVDTPSIGIPHQRPSEPLYHHQVPIHYGVAPIQQPFMPQRPLVPAPFVPPSTLPATFPPPPSPVLPFIPPSAPSVLPAGIPNVVPSIKPSQVGTLPGTVPLMPPTGSHSFHDVPIDFGTRPPLPNLPPPPSIGPAYTPIQPHYDATNVPMEISPSGSSSVTTLHTPPSDVVSYHPDLSLLTTHPAVTSINIRPPTQNVQDPGLTVSKYNRNVLVNRYGGGVVLTGNSQPFKCRSSSGKCNLRRSLKVNDNNSSENHLRLSDDVVSTTLKPVSDVYLPTELEQSL